MSASREQSGLPERYSIIIALVSMAALIAVVVAITTMVILHITDPKAEGKGTHERPAGTVCGTGLRQVQQV